jgi:hypothetical protein
MIEERPLRPLRTEPILPHQQLHGLLCHVHELLYLAHIERFPGVGSSYGSAPRCLPRRAPTSSNEPRTASRVRRGKRLSIGKRHSMRPYQR